MEEPLIKICMGKAFVERTLLLERIAVILERGEKAHISMPHVVKQLLEQLRDEVDPDHKYSYSEKKWL
jgi:hypothetical protein